MVTIDLREKGTQNSFFFLYGKLETDIQAKFTCDNRVKDYGRGEQRHEQHVGEKENKMGF
jgi:hypothetical protein